MVSHTSNNPMKMENCEVHNVASMCHPLEMNRQWTFLLHEIQPDVVHVNCCWIPACAFIQKWVQDLGIKWYLLAWNVGTWIMKQTLLDS